MGSTKPRRKRSPSRKSVTAKLREKVADLEGMLDRSRAQTRQRIGEIDEAARILRGCIPEGIFDDATDIASLAKRFADRLKRAEASGDLMAQEINGARDALRACLPPAKTERAGGIAALARLAAHAASIGQTISTGATKAMRAAGYMPTGPEDVAARIGSALFLKDGQIVVEKWQADALREKFEDIFGGDA